MNIEKYSLDILEDELGYHFKDRTLLQRALTHRSYSPANYERLEFLGDSVLNCVIGQNLFLREDHFDEGSLSRVRANLVCEDCLHEIAKKIGISHFMRLGSGEAKSGGLTRASIMADVMEAIFGAIMHESGFESAKGVILRLYAPILEKLSPQVLSKDSKTRLQEFTQGDHQGLPQYCVVSIDGPAHDQTFTCECSLPWLGILTRGTGKSRRAAEQAAAKAAIEEVHKLQQTP